MDNSTATQLQGDLLLLTQIEFVTPTTVAGTLYGIAFTLFCLYVHSLAPQLRDEERKRQAIFMLVYSSIIMLCGLYDLVTNAWFTQEYYLKHYDYPQGPYIYGTTTLHTPLTISSFTCQVAIDALTSAIQIWRVWVVWSATRYANLVIALPLLSYMTFVGLFLRTLVLEGTQPVAELPILDQKPELIEFALQAAVTILSSMSISLYLVFQHRRQRKLIGEAQGFIGYMNVVTMIIESYALESIWFLVQVTTRSYTAVNFFLESIRYIEIIAYFLLQYRVARGTAYKSQRRQSKTCSSHRDHSHQPTAPSGETRETEIGGPPVFAKQGALDTSPSSSMA